MRDINRIDRITEKINKLWKKYPDQRLGQLLSNYTRLAQGDIFYPEDDLIEMDIDNAISPLAFSLKQFDDTLKVVSTDEGTAYFVNTSNGKVITEDLESIGGWICFKNYALFGDVAHLVTEAQAVAWLLENNHE